MSFQKLNQIPFRTNNGVGTRRARAILLKVHFSKISPFRLPYTLVEAKSKSWNISVIISQHANKFDARERFKTD